MLGVLYAIIFYFNQELLIILNFNVLKTFCKTFSVLILILILSAPSYSASKKSRGFQNSYDVIVAGAGTGGISAAIQAARMGANVLVVESSSWIGGQMTAAGVSTMDDMSRQKSGIYLEFINRVKDYYDYRGKSMGTCYWYPTSLAFEPHIGQEILVSMVNDARRKGVIDFYMNSEIVEVKKNRRTVTGVTVKTPEGSKNHECKVLIDATEYGDILPLAKTQYRIGNSVAKFSTSDEMVQDITWTAVLRKYPGGVPQELRAITPLPGYDLAKRNYESVVSSDGFNFRNKYPIDLPVNFMTHNAYRGLPDSSNPYNYDATPENRPNITKTSVNWANDYPGAYSWTNGKRGLPIAYLENRTLRKQIEHDAFIKTLHFIYYVQNELGENWSVADDEYNNRVLPEAARNLPLEWQEIARRMPVIPYVRESRRAIAKHTLTSYEVLQNSLSYRDGQTNHEFPDAIAIGGYILDLHGANTDADMEWEFEEKASTQITNRPRGPFQVPMDILIPDDTDGLLVAEKNISASRLTAGALRLQPITMMTGQAAGALAALSARYNRTPSEIHSMAVQWELLKSGVSLSLCHYSDVPPEHSLNKSVQISNLYGLVIPNEYPHSVSYRIDELDDPTIAMALIKRDDTGIFGLDNMMTGNDLLEIVERAQKVLEMRKPPVVSFEKPGNFVSRGDFVKVLYEAFPKLKHIERSKNAKLPFKIEKNRNAEYVEKLAYLGILDVYKIESEFHYGRPVTKGEATDIIVRACVASAGE